MEKGIFNLTVDERRVEERDLPFFMGLMRNLFDANFPSPKPIINKNGNYISQILNKKAAVVSFLDGEAKKNLSPENCYNVGVETAKLHEVTKDLSLRRKNNLSLNFWPKLFSKVEKDSSKIHKNLSKTIKISLKEIKRNCSSLIIS